MCGILGYIFNNNYKLSEEEFKENLKILKKRGPNFSDQVTLNDNNYKLYLGHTRLSIIELSNIANQPFKDSENILVFNGEIYNHKSLRSIFNNKFLYKSNSDTETLFYLLKYNNISDVLCKIEGMFSFLFYDIKKKKISISRDRAGEKPLYIYNSKNCLAFTSDLSTFKKNKYSQLTINTNSIKNFLDLNYIPHPETIYNECFKLPPASYIEFDLNKYKFNSETNFNNFIMQEGVSYKKWWKLKVNKEILLNNSYDLIKNNTEKLISDSVKKQLISDVPLGAFLSSGIDSSLIVALMQKFQNNTKTFTIGYKNSNLNEADDAKKISNVLGTDHTEYNFDSKDLINLVEIMPLVYSEPFADSSQIPTFMVSKLASNSVKVALSGDGGDELFGGYNRYLIAKKYWKYFSIFPINIRKKLLRIISFIPHNIFSSIFEKYTGKNNFYKIIDKLNRIETQEDYYYSMTHEWQDINKLLNFDIYNKKVIFDETNNLSFQKKMMLYDFNTYLTDDILCKVDRASMYNSLETRAPYLDYKVSEYCFSIKDEFNFKMDNGKFLLKDILSKYLPESLIQKKKKGFAIPIADWLKNELYDWSNDYLNEDICKKHNFFNYNEVKKLIRNNTNQDTNSNHNKIWSIIQFNKWYLNNL
ncbi:asparagine synthase (glutamine-hydrolyzing) [Pelagibacteraceae bacterium]|nr:asparagine synthase (glutamine-hydrolyzing) [Pelagibacteraceae bacterium]